ncbi:hypothetical protein LTR95_018784, partial [Oleoguttula sp. CCFEE 5521]
MATYSEYQQQPFVTNNDFELYSSFDWNHDQSYLPSTTYAEQSYIPSTTYSSLQTQPAFTHQFSDAYTLGAPVKQEVHDTASAYSPTHSAAHSFDFHQQPPVLSAPSDSGASVQSSVSSAIGSPSVHPQQHSQGWHFQQGVVLNPGIAQHDVLATSGFEIDPIPIMDKTCVGEFNDFPFSFIAPSASMVQHSLASDALASGWPNTTRYEPAMSALSTASMSTVIAASVGSRPALSIQSRQQTASPNDSLFKSPTTPASASSHSSSMFSSPQQINASQFRFMRSESYDESELPQRPRAPQPQLSSPFFSQSSGYFVPPLGSSYPSLIQPYSPAQAVGTQYADIPAIHSPQHMTCPSIPSRAPSRSPRLAVGKVSGSSSPYMRTQQWQPYPALPGSRRQSVSSIHSKHSQGSLSSDDSNKGLCPISTCGKHFKDLKAHMLTHQNERPEKCPIPTCEYHHKGFARKYDKNRHTLTHYKGTMVCGFCPGSGSAAEKSFNRADVFKRHLTSVHNVEQAPPNARRKSPSGAKRPGFGVRDVSGMCSTCGNMFANAQDFYEHLDDCVLRVVQQADPSEAVNEKLLSSVADDAAVQATMEKHLLSTTVDYD